MLTDMYARLSVVLQAVIFPVHSATVTVVLQAAMLTDMYSPLSVVLQAVILPVHSATVTVVLQAAILTDCTCLLVSFFRL